MSRARAFLYIYVWMEWTQKKFNSQFFFVDTHKKGAYKGRMKGR